MCANWEIGHFHLLEFKFREIAQKCKNSMFYQMNFGSFFKIWRRAKWMNYSMQWHFMPFSREIGHFHLLEFKCWEIARKSKKGIIGALFEVCNISASSVQRVERKRNFNEMGFLKRIFRCLRIAQMNTRKAKVDTQFNRVKLIVRSWIAVSHVSEQAFPVLCSGSNFGKG